MEELNPTVKRLQGKFSSLETEVIDVKDKQGALAKDFRHMEENAKFVNDKIKGLLSMMEKKVDISECHKQILYMEAYSCWENTKFDCISDLTSS